MRFRLLLAAAFALALVMAWPAASPATAPNNQRASYEWHLELPNTAQASNGDQISLYDASGHFSVHPKSAGGGGSFTHTFAGGGSASGTWTVNGLVDFQPYGCGVLFGTPGIANFNEQVEGMNLYIKETTRTPSSALAGGFPITQ